MNQLHLPIPEMLVVPCGAEMRANGLVIHQDADDALKTLWQALVVMQECRPWWIGDFLLFLQTHKEEQYKMLVKSFPQADYLRFWEYMRVAEYYPLACRVDGLRWSHHREALGDDIDKSLAYLQHAVEKGLSPVELRAHIRRETMPPTAEAFEPGETWPDIGRVNIWARQMAAKVNALSAWDARRLLQDLEPVVKLVKRLENL
jgi:hypothetical protein